MQCHHRTGTPSIHPRLHPPSSAIHIKVYENKKNGVQSILNNKGILNTSQLITIYFGRPKGLSSNSTQTPPLNSQTQFAWNVICARRWHVGRKQKQSSMWTRDYQYKWGHAMPRHGTGHKARRRQNKGRIPIPKPRRQSASKRFFRSVYHRLTSFNCIAMLA